MDDYELNAHAEIEAWFAKGPSQNPLAIISRTLSVPVDAALALPGVRNAVEALNPAILAGFAVAAKSVSVDAVVSEYNDHDVETLSDVRTLSLAVPDAATEDFGAWYAGGAVVEGAVMSAAALVPFVGNAAAVALIGADVLAVTALGLRMLCDYAVHYGYDPNDEREQLFMMSVFGMVGASTVERAALMKELNTIAVQVAEKATWEQLRHHAAVRVIEKAAQGTGHRLIKRELAVAVPIAGAALGATANGWFMSTLDDNARMAYRRRFLAEKSDPGTVIGEVARSESLQ